MIHLTVMALLLAGFVLLCAAMNRHQVDLFGKRIDPLHTQPLRIAGFTAIAIGFAIDLTAFDAAYGAIIWFGHLSIGAVFSVVVLKWRAHTRRHPVDAPARTPMSSRDRHAIFAKTATQGDI